MLSGVGEGCYLLLVILVEVVVMGRIKPPPSEMLVLAAFSRHHVLLDRARRQAVEAWGPIALESPAFDFSHTGYYQSMMGSELKKVFWGFERLIDPGRLPEIKHATNAWEAAAADRGEFPEPRPLNLDPGYLTLGKLVLASTKDHAHRIYLRDGIFAEITLHYQRGAGWQPLTWTFPDYRREDYRAFFTQCRQYLYNRREA